MANVTRAIIHSTGVAFTTPIKALKVRSSVRAGSGGGAQGTGTGNHNQRSTGGRGLKIRSS